VNTQSLRSILSRRNAAPFTFFLLVVVVVFGFTTVVMQPSATAGGGGGQNNQRPPMPSDEELRKDFNDDDLKEKDNKLAGKWSYGTLLWRRPTPAALLTSPYLDQSLSLRFPDLASLDARIAPPLRSPDTERADIVRCAGEPGLTASAFSSARFEYDTCANNSGPKIDGTGRKSCKESKRTDEYGNRFRYRAKVRDARGAKVGRRAWDVFLLSKP
jgi:hypothetical protein